MIRLVTALVVVLLPQIALSYTLTNELKNVPASISDVPRWHKVQFELGDTVWDWCNRWLKAKRLQAYNAQDCTTEVLNLSGFPATEGTARSLPVGTELWVPALEVERDEVLMRQQARRSGIRPALIADLEQLRENLGITRKLQTDVGKLQELAKVHSSNLARLERRMTGLGQENSADDLTILRQELDQLKQQIKRHLEANRFSVPVGYSVLKHRIDQLESRLSSEVNQAEEIQASTTIQQETPWPLILTATVGALLLLAVLVYTQRRSYRKKIEPEKTSSGHEVRIPLGILHNLKKLPVDNGRTYLEQPIVLDGKELILRFTKKEKNYVYVEGIKDIEPPQMAKIDTIRTTITRAAHQGRLVGVQANLIDEETELEPV